MNNNQGMVSCTVGCWLVAALGGLLAAVLLMIIGGWSFVLAVIAGIVIAAVAGFLLNWIMCRPLPALDEASRDDQDGATHKADAARTAAHARPADAAASATPAAAATPQTASKPKPAAAPVKAAGVKPSKALAGQEDLAQRKGEWTYEGDGEATKPAPKAAKSKAKAAEKPKAKPKAAAKKDATAGAGAGKKPETLSAARDGGPDNLKQIKGVGPKLEALLHSMGFYHFDQVASWGADEVEWVDQNLEGFKGRVKRDEWVAQARILAEGGTTEFSSKVKKGGVY